MKRAIEESFPIVEINRLAVPERNAFSLGTQKLFLHNIFKVSFYDE
jgi:hypothetical protein